MQVVDEFSDQSGETTSDGIPDTPYKADDASPCTLINRVLHDFRA
jgi:hypothetical protein